MGIETDAVAFLAGLAESPHRYDFYQTLRRLESLNRQQPRWGEAKLPREEPVRLGQQPDLAFAPAPIAGYDPGRGGAPPRLRVLLFGLLGPNGPMPIHFTEYVRDRLRGSNDPTLRDFLDVFHHRFLTLFYRAWAQAQPHVNRDRPQDDRFAGYVGALCGLLPASQRDRDDVPDLAKFFHAGALVRHVRNAAGLAEILRQFFEVPIEIEEFVGQWLPLAEPDRTRLGQMHSRLGTDVALGERVWDRQNKFRIRVGPLTLADYQRFLPGASQEHDGPSRIEQLVAWCRLYGSYELDWDVQLVLDSPEVLPLTLGSGGRLGWTTWLGTRRPSAGPAAELCLNAETFVNRTGAPVQ